MMVNKGNFTFFLAKPAYYWVQTRVPFLHGTINLCISNFAFLFQRPSVVLPQLVPLGPPKGGDHDKGLAYGSHKGGFFFY